jgi:hypothetical protein
MALALTCACGARFELEDTLAGQEVTCPECQQPLQAPSLQRPPLRTSLYALASALLALIGAFTVLGTLVAILLGVLALRDIARHRDRVAGAGLAVFGIGAGAVFTVLSILAFSTGELFGLGGRLREVHLADQLDRSGPLEVVRADKGFSISRPTPRWGVAVGNQIDERVLEALQKNRDLILVQPSHYACVDVLVENWGNVFDLQHLQDQLVSDLRAGPRNQPVRFEEVEEDKIFRITQVSVQQNARPVDDLDNAKGGEMTVDLRYAGQPWRMVYRFYKTPTGKLFVLRGYAQKRRFSAAEGEIKQALDSFRILSNR